MDNTNNFKVGDVVHLNSNPEVKFTVHHVKDNDITVSWFDNNNILSREKFPKDTLSLWKSPSDIAKPLFEAIYQMFETTT